MGYYGFSLGNLWENPYRRWEECSNLEFHTKMVRTVSWTKLKEMYMYFTTIVLHKMAILHTSRSMICASSCEAHLLTSYNLFLLFPSFYHPVGGQDQKRLQKWISFSDQHNHFHLNFYKLGGCNIFYICFNLTYFF